MSQTEITVRGSHAVRRAPERAVVRARVELDGPEPVHDRAAAVQQAVLEGVSARHDPERGPVLRWWADTLRTWAERPWTPTGERLALVHHAVVELHVELTDAAALGAWLAEAADHEGFHVDQVDWTLTEPTRQALEAEARTAAVHDARDKAQAYADALGLGPVRVVALADPGLLASATAGAETIAVRLAQDAGGMQLRPADIEVRVDVDARFVAGTAG